MDKQAQSGIGTEIVAASGGSWMQQPGESAQAYAGLRSYLSLEPAKRLIAAAYRLHKGKGPDEQVKVPGYFGGWAADHNWQLRANEHDLHIEALTVVADVKDLQDARRKTVEQATRLQALVDEELERLENQGGGSRWRLGGDQSDKPALLAQLASAIRDEAAARLMALGGTESDYE